MRDRTCTVAGCDRAHCARGFCKPCYMSRWHAGEITPRPRRTSVHERFWSKVDKLAAVPECRPDLGPCWLWTASKSPKGYGRFDLPGRTIGAHRWSYEDVNGSVPVDLELDHLCRVRRCVNPDHLEAVTHQINVERCPDSNARKISCPQGHPYDVVNTYHTKIGGRRCRACMRDETRLRARARRATGRR